MKVNLPKVSTPIFEVEIPSTKAKTNIRPLTAKEEKILLIAKEGNDNSEILSAVKQIVNNCLVEFKPGVNSLTLFDLEYVYLRIMAVSVSNKIKLSYRDNEDGNVREFEVDLDQVKVKFPEKEDFKVPVSDSVTIKLRYPLANLYEDKKFLNLTGEKAFAELAVRCIDVIYASDKTIDPRSMPKEEVEKWVDDLPVPVYNQIKEFLVNQPTLNYEITYTNDKSNERKIVLSTLNDFFMLR